MLSLCPCCTAVWPISTSDEEARTCWQRICASPCGQVHPNSGPSLPPPCPCRCMQSSDPAIYAAGDSAACDWAADESAHWFQMRLWSQVGAGFPRICTRLARCARRADGAMSNPARA